MSRMVPAWPARTPGPWLRELLWRLLLLLCAAAAVVVFALTLMLPGRYSPHRVNAQPLPQVMLVPSGYAREASSDRDASWMLAYCQTRQAAFVC